MTAVYAAHARAAFLTACHLDVAVRKPGNVSHASAGHGMEAGLFVASAQAAAPHLFKAGAGVGERIEHAVAASGAAAGCNTNLGIVLLCAPVAAALERQPLVNRQAPRAERAAALCDAIDSVLEGLSVDDARGTFRAIVQARPGGLGSAPEQDVHDTPEASLRDAMALAAERDRIARLYRDGFDSLFDMALPALGGALSGARVDPGGALETPLPPGLVDAVQRLYLSLLANWPDSHIVRKHGEAVAHSVMPDAARWNQRLRPGRTGGCRPDDDPAFAAWDESLKARRVNPGTTADLTVAGVFLALLTEG